MPSLGSGTLKVETLVGSKYAGKDLYFSAHWVVSREAARQDFDLKNAVKVGEVSDYRGPDRQYFPEEKPDLPSRESKAGSPREDIKQQMPYTSEPPSIDAMAFYSSPEGLLYLIYETFY
jgi:hypothetical protein